MVHFECSCGAGISVPRDNELEVRCGFCGVTVWKDGKRVQ